MEPRAASIRILSCLGYLPPVAIFLLLAPEYRSIRHVRFHSLQSVVLMLLAMGGAVFIGWVGAGLGKLPGIGFVLLSLSGVGITLWMLLMLGCSIYGAITAYQGRSTHLPGLDRPLRKLDYLLERRGSLPAYPPKRRRKPTNRT